MVSGKTRAGLAAGASLMMALLVLSITESVKDVRAFDEAILLAMREPGDPHNPVGPPHFEEFVRDVTALGSEFLLAFGVLSVCGFLAMRGQRHAVLLLLAATLGGYLVAAGLKEIFDRPRPALVSNLMYTTGYRSFPSGHSVMSAAVYLTIGALLSRLVKPVGHKIYFLAMAGLMALMVGLSRIYLGMHYPTDVMAGWIVGALWAGLCWEAANLLQKRGKIEPPE